MTTAKIRQEAYRRRRQYGETDQEIAEAMNLRVHEVRSIMSERWSMEERQELFHGWEVQTSKQS